MEIVVKIVLTVILLGGIYTVWTSSIDVSGTLAKVVPFMAVKTKLDVDFQQVMGAQFRGLPCLLFYVLRFVNTSGENVTVKEILLRVKGRRDVDSTVLTTGEVETPKGERIDSVIVQIGRPPGMVANVTLMNWKNLRPILGEYKTLSPGAVLAGSAAFVMDGMTIDQFKQLKTVELVAIDFSGNEATKEIDVNPDWMKQVGTASVADREFVDRGQGVIWK